MRVVVFGEFEADSPRAHAINVTKTAGGFVRLGHDVTLVCRAPLGAMHQGELARHYGEPGLRWVFVRPDDGAAFGSGAALLASELGADFVYARSFDAAAACAAGGVPTVLETHAHVGDRNPPLLRCLALAAEGGPLAGVVTISESLRGYYASLGAAAERVRVVPDGVDLELFTPPVPVPLPRWGDDGRRHAVYAGHLYDYKGVPTMLDAAGLRPGWVFDLVGGTPEDLARVSAAVAERGLKNVVLHGARPHAEVPGWLWRADALLLPPLGDDPSARWTSPVKLGEYLAAGPMIIASDIPGLRAWVGEPEVRWFVAGDAAGLAEGLDAAAEETAEHRASRRVTARERAERYCYPARAREILKAGGVNEQP
jgi:glycosyltransferase involved in cell wall biosynthesis